MPIGLIEGFDYYPDEPYAQGIGVASTWIGGLTSPNAKLGPGRFEGRSFAFESRGGIYSYATKQVQTTTKCALGFAFRTANLNVNAGGKRFMHLASPDDSTPKAVQFFMNNVGQIALQVNGLVVGRSTRLALENTWHYYEIEVDLDLKTLKFWLDGELQFALQDVGYPIPTIGRIVITTDDAIPSTIWFWDDLYYVYNEARSLGESRIQLAEALSNADVAWTPLAGQNFERIDDASVDSDASYNATNTVGAKDLFNFTDITVNPDTIHAVGIVYAARKEDSGTRTVQSYMESGATPAEGFKQNMTTDYIWTRDIFNLDPNGDVPWTKARVNALKIGYRLVL